MELIRRFFLLGWILGCWIGGLGSSAWSAEGSTRILFSQLGETEGFGADRVSAIVEDQRGTIWLATDEGLCRFDGAQVVTFRSEPTDVATLSSDRITSLVFAPNGQLWVGTADAGLNRFNPMALDAERLPLQSDGVELSPAGREVTDLAVSGGQFLWVATRDGVRIVHLKTHLVQAAKGVPGGTHVIRLFVSSDETIWAGTEAGELYRWNAETSEFQPFWTAGVPVSAIAEGLVEELWIGTLGRGLARLDLKTRKVEPVSLPGRNVTSLHVDSNGGLWAGTSEGLGYLERGAYEFHFYRSDPRDGTSLSGDHVTCLHETRSKVLWVGTDAGKANRFGLDRSWFPHFRSNPEKPYAVRLPHDSVWSMAPSRNGGLWIGTEFGLSRWNPQDETYETPAFDAGIGEPYISSLVETGDGTVWAGTRGEGLIVLPEGDVRRTHRFRHSEDDPTSIGHDSIAVVYEDAGSALWIGTHGAGLWRLRGSLKSFVRLGLKPGTVPEGVAENAARFVTTLTEDAHGRLWIAAADGLFVNDVDGGGLVPCQQLVPGLEALAGESCLAMITAADGRLYIGTRSQGLFQVDVERATVANFVRDNSDLPADTIIGLLADLDGQIWITTAHGLSRFDPELGHFRQFDDRDGLQAGSLHAKACARTRDGMLYFGGAEGFHRVDPKSLPIPRQPPTPILTGLERFGAPVIPRPGGILEKSIAATSVIRMPYEGHNRIGFRFANLGSEFPFRGKFRYRLIGFEGEWQLAQNGPIATYAGIPPGEYEFQVQNSEDGEKWNVNPATVRLSIPPPWWQTLWARVVFGGASLSLAAVAFAVLRRGQVLRMERREQHLKSERDRAEAELAVQLQNAVLLERTTHALSEDSHRETAFEAPLGNIARHYEVSRSLLCALEDEEGQLRRMVSICEHRAHGSSREGAASDGFVIPIDDPFVVEVLRSEMPLQRDKVLAVRTCFQGQANGILVIDGSEDEPRQWRDGEINLLHSMAVQFGIAIAQRDLTRKEEMYRRQLVEARRAAEEANRAKSTFLARITHDLRTPLSAILGFARLLQEDRTLSEQQAETVGIINDSGDHLLTVINETLDVSKIESGQLDIHAETFELMPFLQGIERLLKAKAETKGLALDCSAVTALPALVETDRGKLRQILVNLLGNAIKFTDRGRVELKVACQMADSPDSATAEKGRRLRLYFRVVDTGPGIAREEFPRLFQEFSQTESGRGAADSSGLGLSIVKSFTNLLGGDVDVSSEVGVGSVFEFHILCREGQAVASGVPDAVPVESTTPALPAPGAEGEAQGTASGNAVDGAIRILVADDEKLNRLLLSRILGSAGYQVVEASNGGEALEQWRQCRPQLVLMDENMPVMKGSEVSRIIRQECAEQGAAPILISLTANAFDEARHEALAAGFDDFVSKPFEQDALLAKIRSHLQNPGAGSSAVPMVAALLPA